MEYDLSILLPGIRPYNWQKLYDSVFTATQKKWEIIFVGPYPPPTEMQSLENITYISDFGSPIRCQQIALLQSKGKYITWAADDGYFLPNGIEIGLNLLQDTDYKTIVMQKYYEGEGTDHIMSDLNYYLISNWGQIRSPHIPVHYYFLNLGIVHRQYAYELGGWDTMSFEVCPMAHTDFAVRAQRDGAKFIVQDEVALRCSHMYQTSGDHAPIHYAQLDHDEPYYQKIYQDPNCINRIKIDINNWQLSPALWTRRFTEKG